MIITAEIEQRVMIHPKNMDDIDNQILKKLEETMLRKCLNNMYVIEIIRIIRKGSVTCYVYNNHGDMYVNVHLEVKAIKYEVGEILPNCVIKKDQKNGMLIGDYKNIRITLVRTKINDHLKDGDLFPLIIKSTMYKKFSEQINMTAKTFSRPKNTNVYIIDEKTLSDAVKNQIKYMGRRNCGTRHDFGFYENGSC